jgi:ABC-2 type transport system permease protein
MENNFTYKNNLSASLALAKKELFSLFNSPLFYGAAVFFLLFTSIWLFVMQRYFTMNSATLRPYFAAFPLAFILVIPALTMKSWAEERKMGTAELLLTLPVSSGGLVLGKFLASFVMLAVIIAFTIPLPLSLFPLGSFDHGVAAAEYLGALLFAAAACSLGQFVSCLAKNQASAFIGSIAVLIIVTLCDMLPQAMNMPGAVTAFVNYISLTYHFQSFSKGLLDTRDLLFFVLITALFLYLNTRVIVFRKWK